MQTRASKRTASGHKASTRCFQCSESLTARSKGIVVFDEKTFCSDVCESAWYNTCPKCGDTEPGRCKCKKRGRMCKLGHQWHRCHVHNMRMPGSGHGSGCKCVVERKAQPTDEEALEFLSDKLSDTQKLDIFLDHFQTSRQEVTQDMHSQPVDED